METSAAHSFFSHKRDFMGSFQEGSRKGICRIIVVSDCRICLGHSLRTVSILSANE